MSPELQFAGIQFIFLVISIALHEWGHAKAADMLGDPLPRSQGRVTLDPTAHIDLFGTIIIPLVMIVLPVFTGGTPFALIGWGKPVQVSLIGVKDRKKADLLITAAGPAMNVVIALVGAILIGLCYRFGLLDIDKVKMAVSSVIVLNAALIAFNLLPIPPLDGSHFAKYLFRMKEETYMMLSQYGFIILIVLVNIPPFRIFLHSIISVIATPFLYLLGIVAGV